MLLFNTRTAHDALLPRSRVVLWLKVTLPLMAILILTLTLLSLPRTDSFHTPEIPAPGDLDIQIRSIHYASTLDDGSIVNINAAQAAQSQTNPNTIVFSQPEGDIHTQDSSWLTVQATQGVFDHDSKDLTLSGEVTLFHDQGYEIHTSQSQIHTSERTIEGVEPFLAIGDFGEIQGSGFIILDHKDEIRAKGPARLIIFP